MCSSDLVAYTCNEEIPTLMDEDAFFVVDPGTFPSSCDYSRRVRAKFIMVASNNDKHWGGSNFEKGRGKFVYASLWEGRQVILAKPYLEELRDLPDVDVLHRVRMVGGSLWDILNFDEENFTRQVAGALQGIDSRTALSLVDGTAWHFFQKGDPLSTLIGIGPKDHNMSLCKMALKSDYIEEQVAIRHIKMSSFDEGNTGNR